MCESVGIWFFIVLVAGSPLACDLSSINQCQQTFMNALGFSGDMSSQDMSVLYSLQYADRVGLMCTSFQTYNRCFEPLVSKCLNEETQTRALYYLNDMYTYICNTERRAAPDIVRYSACWNTGYVQNGTTQCLGRYTIASVQELCAYLDNTLTCIGDVVYNHCGAKSATVCTSIGSYSLPFLKTIGSCENVKQTFGTVGKKPYENGRVPSNASSNKPMNSAYVICIAMIFLLSLKKINLFY